MFRSHNDFSTGALMLELKLIKFSDLNKYLTCQFMHKLHYGLVPNVFNDYFTYNRSVHEYNTRLREGFHVPKVGNDYGKRTLKYNGCLLWNKIIRLPHSRPKRIPRSYIRLENTPFSRIMDDKTTLFQPKSLIWRSNKPPE